MDGLVVAWYGWLSGLSQAGVITLQRWADAVHLPLVTAIVLGLIGAASPCQLTTNLGALAYASAEPGRRGPMGLALAYVAGKVTVYTLAGAAVIIAGWQLQSASLPVIIVARKTLGPLMIIVGAAMLGVWCPRMSIGQSLAERLRARLPGRGLTGAYLLGVAFSFAFCPTLFWLFFGLTIPLALRSVGGWAFPGLFALGASVPLLLATGVVAAGVAAVHQVTGGLACIGRPLRGVAAVVLIVAGLHDTLIYWLL